MIAIVGACLCLFIVVLSILLILGLPIGELTMGGQYKVFPVKLRFLLFLQLFLQIFFIVIILQMGGWMPLWFSWKTTRTICIVFAAYLSLNSVMNFCSRSKKEKYIMTPLALVTAICFWVTAL